LGHPKVAFERQDPRFEDTANQEPAAALRRKPQADFAAARSIARPRTSGDSSTSASVMSRGGRKRRLRVPHGRMMSPSSNA
jgi:hypothetical protein